MTAVTERKLKRRSRLLRPRMMIVGLTILGVFVFVAIFADLLSPFDPLEQDVMNRLATPSAVHPLGTDDLGRDVLSRLLHAARVDIPVGILVALLPAILGTTVGVISAYFGGWLDAVVMRISDVLQAFPAYILIIALSAFLGQGVPSIIVAFTLLGWVVYARIVRTAVLGIKNEDFVHAAKLAGVPTHQVIRKHVLPNSLTQVLVYFPLDIVFATLTLAAFSFLGLGVPAPTPEWGAMIADGQIYVRDQWWLATVPGLVIVVYGLGFSLIAESLPGSDQ